MNSWQHQRMLFKHAINCDDINSFINQYQHQIDIDCFGKYCIDISDIKLLHSITKKSTSENITSWLITCHTNEQVKYY
jgi:hypothetical protein